MRLAFSAKQTIYADHRGGWPVLSFLELFLRASRSQRIPLVYFVEAISNYRVLRVPCPRVWGGRAFDVSHAQRLKALSRATASTFYHVQLLSAIAAFAFHTREK
jgi:hypothetical protein